jgi:hypothetical protein
VSCNFVEVHTALMMEAVYASVTSVYLEILHGAIFQNAVILIFSSART